MKCGKEFGTCPVMIEKKLHKVHGGLNAGRACWVVGGSCCGGRLQGTFSEKFESCTKCAFYKNVRREEFPNFELSPSLLLLLNSNSPANQETGSLLCGSSRC